MKSNKLLCGGANIVFVLYNSECNFVTGTIYLLPIISHIKSHKLTGKKHQLSLNCYTYEMECNLYFLRVLAT